MGLFDKLKPKKKEPFVYTFPDVPVHEIPYGDHMVDVYTYYGSPLDGVRRGSKIVLDVLPGEWQMKSEYTGKKSARAGAVAYKGRPIGFVRSGRVSKYLTILADDYAHVTVHARYVSTDPRGWPVVVLMVPNKLSR